MKLSPTNSFRNVLFVTGFMFLFLGTWRCPYVMGFKQTTGFVSRIYQERDRDQNFKTVTKVEVRYEHDQGTERWDTGRSFSVEECPSDCKIGDRVTVFYEPRGKNVMIGRSMWVYSAVAGAIGCLFIISGLVLFRVRQSGGREDLS
ncbi:MAG: hypothetical protein JWM68_4347 [Verrucomicrobiales bacterium]|nr:hypothetical protein [Verrucomicrobiales bacterium]